MVPVSWSLPICRIELIDTPVEYENAVKKAREKKWLKEDFQLSSSDETVNG